MIEERADDVYHFEFNTYKNDVKKVQEMLIESFDSQNPQPYSIPVDSQEDVKKSQSIWWKSGSSSIRSSEVA